MNPQLEPAPAPVHDDFFVGRQPILKADNSLYGYELLFRGGLHQDAAQFDCENTATATVIRNAMMNIGLEELVGKNKAFINFPQEFFSEGQEPCFSSKQVVLEILEDVEPTQEAVLAIQKLKKDGYKIALDDFVFKKKLISFIQMADIIKFDIQYTKLENLKPLFERVKRMTDVTILAERVETKEMFEAAKEAGADLFQGYYFSKPEIVSGKKLEVSKLSLIKLLQKLIDPDLHLDDLEKIIEQDVGLSMKILKMAAQYRTQKMPNFTNLKDVMMLFGLKRVQSWATLISMTAMEDTVPEIFNLARLRAIFMRNVAIDQKLPVADSFYLAGLFSLLDVILGQALRDALEKLPLSEDIKQGLVEGTGEYGRLLKIATSFELRLADRNQEYALFYLDALTEINAATE